MADDDWTLVVNNLSRARAVWKWMTRILSREGAEPRVSIFFFKAVVQAVLLFGLETWVVTPRIVRVLGGFQDQVPRRLTRRIPWQKNDGKWEYTSAATKKGGCRFPENGGVHSATTEHGHTVHCYVITARPV